MSDVDQPHVLVEPKRPEERFLGVLQRHGFRVLEREVHLQAEGLRHGPRFDFLVERGEQRFAVEIKVARGWADWLFHWLARPILVLQAARRLRGWEPLLGVYVRELEPKAVHRFRSQAKVYAPDLWWILADAEGRVVSHLPDGDAESLRDSAEVANLRVWNRQSPSGLASYSQVLPGRQPVPRLSFGDLDQWLMKVLLFAPVAPNWWCGPRGPIRSLLQLAKVAEVSPPLVYRWAAAMEASGYLRRSRWRMPGLQNPDALLSEWSGRYRLSDNELFYCRPVFAQRVDESYLHEFLGALRQLNRPEQVYALSGHQACRFYQARHSLARSIHLYVGEEPRALMEALHLVRDPNPAAPVVLLRAKYPRSILRAAARMDGIVVCDALQVYLDLFHLPDRGREQADVLYASVLKGVLSTAVESSIGV